MEKQQHITIFTTASIPWLTGTAVNPLFRAAYLAKDGSMKVTLVVPWLPLIDQEHLFPNNITFDSHLEQEKYIRQWVEERTGFVSNFSIRFYPGKEKYIRQWVEERTGFVSNFSIRFYPGKFSVDKRSILALGDITVIIPDDEADIAVLEEPEHLTWYHHGKRWKEKIRLVVGIVHTNYWEIVRRERNILVALLIKYINGWVVDIYCHKVIRLSAATQDLPRSVVCNVHGVNPKFLDIGLKTREKQQNDNQAFNKGIYYIGKKLWNKGYKELLDLLRDHQKELSGFEIDLYGSGEDSAEIAVAAKKLELTVRVHPGRDHADQLFHDYKVLLNPSTTDVVCTTSAEALAMGKIVVCANHPSNEFFMQFPNCRTYDDGEGFVKTILKALSDEPAPLTDAQRHALSWEAATERFLKAAELDTLPTKHQSKTTISMPFLSTSLNLTKKLEDASALVHFLGTGFLSSQPDEEQCKELGLKVPPKKTGFSSGKWI